MIPADKQASKQRFWKTLDSPVWQLISGVGLVVVFFLNFVTPLGFAHGIWVYQTVPESHQPLFRTRSWDNRATLLGYQVVIATNAKEALQLPPLHEDIDLLFTDAVMPGEMNVRQLANAVLAKRPELKVLFRSGYTENSIVHHGRLNSGVQLLS